MKIIWKVSKDNQLINFKFCARQINQGFYQKLRFYILPFIPKKFRGRVIYFPYIKSFAKYFKNVRRFTRQSDIPSCVKKDIQTYMNKQFKKDKSHILKNKSNFHNVEKQFKKHLEQNFPKIKNYKVIIYPNLIGSVGYYDYNEDTILVYPRFDRDVNSICKLIITASTHLFEFPNTIGTADLEMIKDDSWFKKQKRANDIARSKTFKSTIEDKQGIIDILYSNFSGNLVLESCKYLNKLGYPIKPELNNSKYLRNMTKSQKALMVLLIKHKRKIISFEEIADVIWHKKSFERYSLYAISKHIERIRKKLMKNNLKVNLIHTQRGKGYILYD